jgi:hypothetical protein
MDFYMHGKGRDLEDLVKSATGRIRVVSSFGGYAHDELIEYLYGKDFLTSIKDEVEGIFTGKKNNGRMRIYCAVANLLVRGGRIDLDRNVAAQTKAVNMLLAGSVDFGRETMALSLVATPTDGLKLSISGNLMSSMEFAGSLSEPELKLNQGAAIGKVVTAAGVGLVVGALTGGVGLLVGAGVGLLGGDVISNWTADEEPCRTALKETPPAGSGDPAFLGRPLDRLVEDFLGD